MTATIQQHRVLGSGAPPRPSRWPSFPTPCPCRDEPRRREACEDDGWDVITDRLEAIGDHLEAHDSVVQRLATLPSRLDPGMSRRTLLRTLANAGYAVGLATWLGVDDFLAVEEGSVPIVTALVRADADDPWSLEERTRSVPAEWYASVNRAFELNELVSRLDLGGYLASAVLPGDYRSGTASISVNVSPGDVDRVADLLGPLLRDVDVSVEGSELVGELEEQTDITAGPHYVESLDHPRIPGGVRCENDHAKATLTPALYQPDGERAFFATANHAYNRHDEAVGATLSLRDGTGSTATIGRVSEAHPVEDLVAVEPTGSHRPASTIQGATPGRVVGQLTKFGLADLAARDERLEKVGSSSHLTDGSIKGIDATTCFTSKFCRSGQLLWGRERGFTDSDSGSVSFYTDVESGGLLIASTNIARTWWPGQNFVWGPAAYHLTDRLGYHF